MVLQQVLFSSDCCKEERLFFRSSSNTQLIAKHYSVKIPKETNIRTNTYFNVFDAGLWKKHTVVVHWFLDIILVGDCEVRLLSLSHGKETVWDSQIIQSAEPVRLILKPKEVYQGVYYFQITAFGETDVIRASYNTEEETCRREIVLGLNICTFHRQEYIRRNLEKLKQSEFFHGESSLYGKLYITIVDNGSDLRTIDTEYIQLLHNPNTGGSGGFTRGIEEYRKKQEITQITHMIFMDDDVDFDLETFYRVYRFLGFAEDTGAVIAGRFFRNDQRSVQFTAVENWNQGSLFHIGYNADMAVGEKIEEVNDNEGAQYGGWWFCCYPAGFVFCNQPFPFFLHCDDVEYGLRYRKKPLVLNGVQVWHETYEYRKTDQITYYDTRNSMIVNSIYNNGISDEEAVLHWKQDVQYLMDQRLFLTAYMKILAMKDFLHGMNWLQNIDSESYHKKLMNRYRIKKGKVKRLFFFSKMKACFGYKKAVNSYKQSLKQLVLK